MKFMCKVKWKMKTLNDMWHEGLFETYHFIEPGAIVKEDKFIISICVKPYAILFKLYPFVKFDIENITDAIAYAAGEGLLEETAELIHAAKVLGIGQESQNMRL